VSVVVPVYDGEATLAELVDRTVKVLEPRGAPFEIILVNDGSRDASWSRIVALAAGDARVRGLDLTRNFGQHAALLAGIRLARHAVTVTMDDDLQHPPEAIPRLLDAVEADRDVVYGTPSRDPRPLLRRASSWLLHGLLAGLLGSETEQHSSSFRAFRTGLRDAFADYRGAFVTLDALLTWGASRFDHVLVEHAPRRQGRSTYTTGRLVRHALNTVTNFSVRPLHLVSLLGFSFTLIGISAMGYAVGFYRLRGLPVPPDTFIFAVVCLFSGIQLFTLGVIGEYLARVHVRSMNRPAYVIRRDTGARDGEA
jgi:undecaprenyl-phosphate 4-deoxy-4-formamido-L-arabinose transferase